jgi:hypothetical protein
VAKALVADEFSFGWKMNGAAGAGRNEPATESLVVDQVAASHDKDLESGLSDENSIVNRDMPAAAPLPNLTPSDEVAKEEAATNIVSWDGEHDEDNPMNWKSAKKWRILAVVSMMTFVTCVQRIRLSRVDVELTDHLLVLLPRRCLLLRFLRY